MISYDQFKREINLTIIRMANLKNRFDLGNNKHLFELASRVKEQQGYMNGIIRCANGIFYGVDGCSDLERAYRIAENEFDFLYYNIMDYLEKELLK